MINEQLLLEGRNVRLEPLAVSHHDELLRVVRDGELWNLSFTVVPSAETMASYLHKALEAQTQGREIPFVIVHKPSGTIVGSTRYMYIDVAHRRREIGCTWLAASYQRTAVNTEAKYLLLKHAFEEARCIRMEFITDVLNERSRAALARIGAKQEGILRNHMIMPSGRYRDSVTFSIIETEWPDVRQHLLQKLQWEE